VLSITNYLNEEGHKKAGILDAFKLSSLNKLSGLKSPNNKQVTLLRFIAEAIRPELLEWISHDLFQFFERTPSAMFQLQNLIPSVLPQLLNMYEEIEVCNTKIETYFKKSMQEFTELVKESVRDFNKKLIEFEKKNCLVRRQ